MKKQELYRDLILSLEGVFDQGIEDSLEGIVKISLLSKYIKTLKAIALLDNEGYFEDAQILVRSLFEILITVSYSEFHHTYNRYMLYSYVTRKKLLDKFKSKGFNVREEIEQEIKNGYEKFINNFNISGNDLNTWNGISFRKTVYDVASNYDLRYIIILYEAIYIIASGHVHSESLSSMQYINLSDLDNNIVDYKIDANKDESYLDVFEKVSRLNEVFLPMYKGEKYSRSVALFPQII